MAFEPSNDRTLIAHAGSAISQIPGCLMELPEPRADDIDDLHRNLSDLVSGVIRTNVRTAERILRVANHADFVLLQQQFICDYMAALLQGSLQLTSVIQRMAGQCDQQPLPTQKVAN